MKGAGESKCDANVVHALAQLEDEDHTNEGNTTTVTVKAGPTGSEDVAARGITGASDDQSARKGHSASHGHDTADLEAEAAEQDKKAQWERAKGSIRNATKAIATETTDNKTEEGVHWNNKFRKH